MKTSNSSDSEEEGTRHFMVNVVQPQFNLHSEEANVSILCQHVSQIIISKQHLAVQQISGCLFNVYSSITSVISLPCNELIFISIPLAIANL